MTCSLPRNSVIRELTILHSHFYDCGLDSCVRVIEERPCLSLRMVSAIVPHDVGSIGALCYQGVIRQKTVVGIYRTRYLRLFQHVLMLYDDSKSEHPLSWIPLTYITKVDGPNKREAKLYLHCREHYDYPFSRLRSLSMVESQDLGTVLRALIRHPQTRINFIADPTDEDAVKRQRKKEEEGPLPPMLVFSSTFLPPPFQPHEWIWKDTFGVWRALSQPLQAFIHHAQRVGHTGIRNIESKWDIDLKRGVLRNLDLGLDYALRQSLPTSDECQDRLSLIDAFVKVDEPTLVQVNEITKLCRQLNESFIDPVFPPCDASLYLTGQRDMLPWDCGQCTLTNAPELITCRACQARRIVVTRWLRPLMQHPPQVLRTNDNNNVNQKPKITDNARCSVVLLAATVKKDHPGRASLPNIKHQNPQRIKGGGPGPQPPAPRTSWHIFAQRPRPEDIQQGAIGNCWFLSALAVLAERPALIEQLMLSKEYNASGIYLVQLCRDGQWQKIVVDDFFPCTDTGRLAYSQARRNQLWVPLIEKALAKSYGSYEAISSGQVYEGLSILTGSPVVKLNLQPQKSAARASSVRPLADSLPEASRMGRQNTIPEESASDPLASPSLTRQRIMRVESTTALGMMGYEDAALEADIMWIRLLSFREAGYLMGASCGIYEEDSVDIHSQVGLQRFHAYSVLDVRAVGSHRLLRLRNPWGRVSQLSWSGPWSFHSSDWTPELRAQLELREIDERDGIFWISFSDVTKYFGRIDVCKCREDWIQQRFVGTFLTSASVSSTTTSISPNPSPPPQRPQRQYTIRPQVATLVEIELRQKGDRGQSKNKDNENHNVPPVDMGIVILKQVRGNSTYELVIDSPRSTMTYATVEAFLEAGETYLILPLGFNKLGLAPHSPDMPNNAPGYVLVCHSSKPVSIQPSFTTLAMTAIALATRARKHGECKQLFEGMVTYTQNHDAGSVVLVENTSSSHFFQVEMDNSDCFNICSSRRGTGRTSVSDDAGIPRLTSDSVPPRHWQIIQVLSQVTDAGYSWSSKLRYNMKSKMEPHTPCIDASGIHCPQPFL